MRMNGWSRHSRSRRFTGSFADKLETSDKLTKVEIARVREVVEQAFSLTRTPLEILQACNDTPRR